MKFLGDFTYGFATAIACFISVFMAGILIGTMVVSPSATTSRWDLTDRQAREVAPEILAERKPCDPRGEALINGMTVTGQSIDTAHIWSISYICPDGRQGTVLWNPQETPAPSPTPEPTDDLKAYAEETPTPEPT